MQQRLMQWDAMGDWWQRKPLKRIRCLTSRAVFSLCLENGGRYTRHEVREIVADLLGIERDFKFRDLKRGQCQALVIKLIVLGLV